MLIDTHAHLNFNIFQKSLDAVVRRCQDSGVWVINVGSDYGTSKMAAEIVQRYGEGFFAAIGLHPINLDTGLVKIKKDEWEESIPEKEFDYQKYKELALDYKPQIVAIGEIGLDYYWKPKTKRKLELFKQMQKKLLKKQLMLAKELNLPVIFHCRMAHDDLIQFLIENPEIKPSRAVAHGFVGSLEQLKKYLEFGYHVGFNGIIFKTIAGIDFKAIIQNTPLERMLIETDCPYLVPSGFPGPNEPVYLKYIAQKITEIRHWNSGEVLLRTAENARKLFGI